MKIPTPVRSDFDFGIPLAFQKYPALSARPTIILRNRSRAALTASFLNVCPPDEKTE